MNHLKRMWGHYLALFIIIIILVFPISWIYKLIQSRYGIKTADLSLMATIMIVLLLAVRGAVHAHRIYNIVREQVDQTVLGCNQKSVVLKVLGVDIQPATSDSSESKWGVNAFDKNIKELISFPRKHRGKQSRFPEDKIVKAVLKWERRDRSFPARTLEEFLEQEFGSGSDGILLMATSTFYDYRREILKEIEKQQEIK